MEIYITTHTVISYKIRHTMKHMKYDLLQAVLGPVQCSSYSCKGFTYLIPPVETTTSNIIKFRLITLFVNVVCVF